MKNKPFKMLFFAFWWLRWEFIKENKKVRKKERKHAPRKQSRKKESFLPFFLFSWLLSWLGAYFLVFFYEFSPLCTILIPNLHILENQHNTSKIRKYFLASKRHEKSVLIRGTRIKTAAGKNPYFCDGSCIYT